MGEAKRRRAEIEELKPSNPELAAHWRQLQLQEDKRRKAAGISSISPDPVGAMARALSVLFDQAKRTGDRGGGESVLVF